MHVCMYVCVCVCEREREYVCSHLVAYGTHVGSTCTSLLTHLVPPPMNMCEMSHSDVGHDSARASPSLNASSYENV